MWFKRHDTNSIYNSLNQFLSTGYDINNMHIYSLTVTMNLVTPDMNGKEKIEYVKLTVNSYMTGEYEKKENMSDEDKDE